MVNSQYIGNAEFRSGLVEDYAGEVGTLDGGGVGPGKLEEEYGS